MASLIESSHTLVWLPPDFLNEITEYVATGETPEDAAVNAIQWGRACRVSCSLTREPKVVRVITDVRHSNEALIAIWKSGANLPQLPTTARQMRGWIADPSNAPILRAVEKIEAAGCELKVVPLEIAFFSGLGMLNFNNNQITQIPEQAFAGCSALRQLYLDCNQITQIPERAFAGCSALSWLYLEDNQITQITERTFAGCGALRELRLNGNQITQIPERAFAGCSALVCLSLGGNKITHIDSRILAGCGALQMLGLQNNQIAYIDSQTFASCPALDRLSLAGNQITQIAPRTFASCPGLSWLCLSKNSVTQIDGQAFAGCGALRYLDLNDNPITYIDPQAFAGCPAIKELGFGHNMVIYEYLSDSPQNFCEKFNAFSRYVCRSQWAMFHQAVSAGKLPIVDVVEHIKHLKNCNLIYERVYLVAKIYAKELGNKFSDGGDPQWGEHHVCDNMIIFYRALTDVVRNKYEALSAEQRDVVVGRIYAIAREDAGLAADAPAWGDPLYWGLNHSKDNILRLIDAMADF